jgi:hypothetical protein
MTMTGTPLPPPERTLTLAKSEYATGADRLLALAQRELHIFDPDLSEFRLELPSRVEALRQFLARSPTNQLHIALHDPEYTKRHCPRLMTLLGLYSASMRIHRTQGEAGRVQDCFVLADRLHVVRRPVAAQGRGVIIINDPREGLVMHERFSEIWELSEPGASAAISGL